MTKPMGDPDYPVVLYVTQEGDDKSAPTAWSLTKGYEVISDGSSSIYDSAEASAAASVLFLGNRTRVYTNCDTLRARLKFSGVDNVATAQEFGTIQSGIKDFAVRNNVRMLVRIRAEKQNQKTSPMTLVEPPPAPKEAKQPKGINSYGKLPRLTIATDASMSHTHTVAGVAWVAEDGRHSVKAVDVGEGGITIAELWAIHNIFPNLHKRQKLLIQSDCFPAIQAFIDRDKILGDTRKHNAKKIEVLEAISREMEYRDVEIMWVKGHDGYALNETADQLAKFSRHRHETGDTSPEAWDEVDRILLDGIGFDRASKSFVDTLVECEVA